MKQLVVPQLPESGGAIRLDREQSHYLARVRRVAPGDRVTCIDARGRLAEGCIVTSIARGVVELSVPPEAVRLERTGMTTAESAGPAAGGGKEGASRSGGLSSPPVALYVALLKGKKLDTVVRQVTELGVDRIVPVLTRHCVSRPAGPDLEKKSRRWQEIARAATQQSGRRELPVVEPPLPLEVAATRSSVADPQSALSLALHEDAPEALTLGSLIRIPPPTAIRVLVGPEGGLAPGEIDLLVRSGWAVRRIPVPVLRAETAAVAAATLVQSLRSEYTAPSSQTG
jgi:16S rRNA (uracil1498-N3)-methyltransferase